ncbi:hypothetical protein [Mycobacterium sp. C31M]
MRSLIALALFTGAVALAPAASAVPDCVQVSLLTTQCSTPGHTSISTFPPPMNYGPWQWWQWGGGGFYFGW